MKRAAQLQRRIGSLIPKIEKKAGGKLAIKTANLIRDVAEHCRETGEISGADKTYRAVNKELEAVLGLRRGKKK